MNAAETAGCTAIRPTMLRPLVGPRRSGRVSATAPAAVEAAGAVAETGGRLGPVSLTDVVGLAA